MRSGTALGLAFGCVAFGATATAGAATLAWKGHTWQVTSGAMAGVCQGDPRNVTVDGNGYLHLRIANSGGTWTSSELFTADRLGFGTYQWQVDGPIDTVDKNVVLGLFPYGPAAGIGVDGTNEIDIEYARWGQAAGPNGDWTDYPASGTTIGELSYTFSLGGTTLSTSRLVWSSTSIADALLSGLQPVDGMTGLIKSWTYAPPKPSADIPQQPLPLGMNLWCFDAPPSDGLPVEIVIRDFAFVAAGGVGGAGGTAGSAGTAGTPGTGGTAGATGGAAGRAGTAGTGGSAATGGAAGRAGTAGTGGAPGSAGGTGTTGTAGTTATGGTTGAAGTTATGGTTGAAGTAATGGTAGAAGAPAPAGASGGCSCRAGAPSASPGWLDVLCLALLFVTRRRHSRRV